MVVHGASLHAWYRSHAVKLPASFPCAATTTTGRTAPIPAGPTPEQFSKSAVTHKATKMALKQLNESLSEELLAEGLSNIAVHNLSPGRRYRERLKRGCPPSLCGGGVR